ncbi:MAG: AmpD protein [Limisphaerales bacterium]|jgi:AmpD protein
MKIGKNHKLEGAVWHSTVYCSERPLGGVPELIVLHCISLPEGRYGAELPIQLFTGDLDISADPSFADLEGVQVSPHLLIDRLGGVHQFVGFDQQAWHAGASSWMGRPGCNGYSIGIELEGCVSEGYEDVQYSALQQVLISLLLHYERLSVGNIVGHAEIAPMRKVDPGPYFNWSRVLHTLHSSLHSSSP